MNFQKWMRRLIWVGITGVAGILAGTAPTCRAQEVNPDHFTATGIEGVDGKELVQKPAGHVKALVNDRVREQASSQRSEKRTLARAAHGTVVLAAAENRSGVGKREFETH